MNKTDRKNRSVCNLKGYFFSDGAVVAQSGCFGKFLPGLLQYFGLLHQICCGGGQYLCGIEDTLWAMELLPVATFCQE